MKPLLLQPLYLSTDKLLDCKHELLFSGANNPFHAIGADVANTTQPNTSDKSTPRKRRLSRDARKDEIVQAAIQQFAEAGFDGSTRDIAQRAGITQPLLYRYFPSKEDLIEAVYERVYLDRWDSTWDAALTDRSRPVKDRFHGFYEEYTQTVFDPVWLRISSFAALRNAQVHDWYNHVVQEMILKPLVRERRVELGFADEVLVSQDALVAPWLMHGSLLHYAERRFVLEIEMPDDTATVISQALDMYLLLTQSVAENGRTTG